MDKPRSDDIFYRNDYKEYPYLVLKVPDITHVSPQIQVSLLAPFFSLTNDIYATIDIKQISVVEKSTIMKAMTYQQVQELNDIYKKPIRAYKLNMIRLHLLTKLNLKKK